MRQLARARWREAGSYAAADGARVKVYRAGSTGNAIHYKRSGRDILVCVSSVWLNRSMTEIAVCATSDALTLTFPRTVCKMTECALQLYEGLRAVRVQAACELQRNCLAVPKLTELVLNSESFRCPEMCRTEPVCTLQSAASTSSETFFVLPFQMSETLRSALGRSYENTRLAFDPPLSAAKAGVGTLSERTQGEGVQHAQDDSMKH